MYNHATFCDIVITGLVGLRPRQDEYLELNPLIDSSVAYIALDGVQYHGRSLTIAWDRDGSRYGRGKGLSIWVDGEPLFVSAKLGAIKALLPAAGPQSRTT